MRRFASICRYAAVFVLLVVVGPATAQETKTPYNLGLVVESSDNLRLDGDVLNATTEAFVQSRRFTVVERGQLEPVFTEKDLQGFLSRGSQGSLEDLLELNILGLITYSFDEGALSGTPPRFTIEVRMVDARTGWILGSLSSERSEDIAPPSTYREAAGSLLQNIREAFPLFGYVVRIKGREVVVDLGSDDGVKDGDILEALQEDEQIIHPVTGEVLPGPRLVIGELKVVFLSPRLSTCWLKLADGVSLGTLVRLKGRSSMFNDTWRSVSGGFLEDLSH